MLDALPTGLLFQSATSSQGNYDSTSGLWSVGSLGTGASATLTINAIFDTATSVTNTATVFSELPDPGRGDNSASVTVPQQIADLALAKTVNNPQPNLNSVVTFTITVSNRGPNSATGVRVKDRLGAGLTFQSVTPSQGAYDAPSGIWQVGTVTSGNSAQLVIQALVTSAGTVLNTAEVIASDQFDPTSTLITTTPTRMIRPASRSMRRPPIWRSQRQGRSHPVRPLRSRYRLATPGRDQHWMSCLRIRCLPGLRCKA